MARLRTGVEEWFLRLGHMLCRRPWWAIATLTLAVVAIASQAPRLAVDTSPEAMLHRDDLVRLDYDAFRREFGRDEFFIVAVPAPPVLDALFLDRLQALHRDLEHRVPYLREVTSLVNARYARGEDDAFVVGELMKDWLAAGGDAASLQIFAAAHPLYRDNLISNDGRLVALLIETRATATAEPLGDDAILAMIETPLLDVGSADEPRYLATAENAAIVDAVTAVLAQHRREGFEPILSGTPVVVDAYNRATMRDMALCAASASAGVLLVLGWFFRRASGVMLPNLVATGAMAATFGLMAASGAPFTLATNAVVPILLAVGVCSSVHLLSTFYRRFEASGDKPEAIAYALQHAAIPIILTALTTAAGLFSFAWADLSYIADMGSTRRSACSCAWCSRSSSYPLYWRSARFGAASRVRRTRPGPTEP